MVLYGGRAFFALASVPDWVSGVYDGKIRVALRSNAEEPGALEAVLAHELGHALLRQMTGDGAPAWLHEGLAQWLSRDAGCRGSSSAPKPGAARTRSRTWSGGFGEPWDAERAAYADSLSLIEYLVAVRGEGAVACLVTRLREGASFDDALRGETGLAPRELSRRLENVGHGAIACPEAWLTPPARGSPVAASTSEPGLLAALRLPQREWFRSVTSRNLVALRSTFAEWLRGLARRKPVRADGVAIERVSAGPRGPRRGT